MKRVGAKNKPVFRIVVADGRSPRDGKFIEEIGTYQPLKQGENYEAIFSEGRAEFRRRDFDWETHTEIVVSPEDDIEVRRVDPVGHCESGVRS